MARDDPHFRLRIPEELHARLTEQAKENHRSINAEIVARLEESFEVRGKKGSLSKEQIREFLRRDGGFLSRYLNRSLIKEIEEIRLLQDKLSTMMEKAERIISETQK